MRHLISSLLMLVLLASCASAAPPPHGVEVAKAKASALLALCRTQFVAVEESGCPCYTDLCEAQALAKASKRPLLVWVGGCPCELRQGFCDCVNCQCDEYAGITSKRLVIPTGQGFAWYWENPCQRNLPEIRETITPPQVMRTRFAAHSFGGSCSTCR